MSYKKKIAKKLFYMNFHSMWKNDNICLLKHDRKAMTTNRGNIFTVLPYDFMSRWQLKEVFTRSYIHIWLYFYIR